MFYLQIAAAVVSILLGITQMTKESQPIVQKMQEKRQLAEVQRRQQDAQRRAYEIANMGINWQYRSNDGVWRYYSDPTGHFWCRVNIQGVYEYSENPHDRIASNPVTFK